MHIISAKESNEVRASALAVAHRLVDFYKPHIELYGNTDLVLPKMQDGVRKEVIERLAELFGQKGYRMVEKPVQENGTRVLCVRVP